MRIVVKAILLAGFCAAPLMQTTPAAVAANLAITPVEKKVRVIHHRKRIVRWSPVRRDYDGTAVRRRLYRTVALPGYDGTVVLKREYELVPVKGASPTHYLNGQPVLPSYPLSWPRRARDYDLRISVRSYSGI